MLEGALVPDCKGLARGLSSIEIGRHVRARAAGMFGRDGEVIWSVSLRMVELERMGLVSRIGREHRINFPWGCQNDRHRIRVDRRDDSISVSHQEAEYLTLAWRADRHGVHNPAKANSGRSSLSANHFGVL